MRHIRMGFWDGIDAFVKGVGSVLDIGGTNLNYHNSLADLDARLGGPEDDAEALRGDWNKVLKDMEDQNPR